MPGPVASREDRSTLARQLRDARLARGWTQRAAGEQLGVSANTVARWERGERVPGSLAQLRLGELLGLQEPPSDGSLGARLRRVRARLGMTQAQVGELLAVHANTVARWERSDPEPGPGFRGRVAEFVERHELAAASGPSSHEGSE